MKNISKYFVYGLLIFTAIQWGEGIWIFGKAQVAQILIAHAWQSTLQAQVNTNKASQRELFKPWSWADISPLARMQWLPKKSQDADHTLIAKEDLYILSGAHGEALAFGPGHLHGTAQPGTGVSVIAGHRDTHFQFLEDVKAGDELKIQTLEGSWKSYTVQTLEVRHIKHDPLVIDENQEGLLLITCYPFHSLRAGGPLRYVVWATLEQPNVKPLPKNWQSTPQLVFEESVRISF